MESTPVIKQQHSSPYAGFWLRVLAFAIDGTILAFLFYLIEKLISQELMRVVAALIEPQINDGTFIVGLMAGALVAALFALLLVQFLVGLFYFVLFEGTMFQATPGKLLVGLRVATTYRGRIGVPRAIARHFGRYLFLLPPIAALTFGLLTSYSFTGMMIFALLMSMILLVVAYPMAGLTENKQALHDFIAGTVVIRTDRFSPNRVILGCLMVVILQPLLAALPQKAAPKPTVPNPNFKHLENSLSTKRDLTDPSAPQHQHTEHDKAMSRYVPMDQDHTPPIIPADSIGIAVIAEQIFVFKDYVAFFDSRKKALQIGLYQQPVSDTSRTRIIGEQRFSLNTDTPDVVLDIRYKLGSVRADLTNVEGYLVRFENHFLRTNGLTSSLRSESFSRSPKALPGTEKVSISGLLIGKDPSFSVSVSGRGWLSSYNNNFSWNINLVDAKL